MNELQFHAPQALLRDVAGLFAEREGGESSAASAAGGPTIKVDGAPCRFALCPHGARLALARGPRVAVVRADAPEQEMCTEAAAGVTALAWLDQSLLACGTAEGHVVVLNADDPTPLLSHRFHSGAVVSLRPASNPAGSQRELWAVYEGGVVVQTTYRDLRKPVRTERGGERVVCQKWRLSGQESVADAVFVGAVPAGLFSEASPKTLHVVAVGTNPFVAFYELGGDGASLPNLGQLVSVVADKLTSWWLPGALQGRAAGGEADDEAEQAARSAPSAQGLTDPRRAAHQVVVDPSGRLAAVADRFGRVLLVDAARRRVVRLWKGVRDARLGWLEDADAGLCLCIYGAQRGIVEVWRARHGPCVRTLDVGAGARLLTLYPSGAGVRPAARPEGSRLCRCLVLLPTLSAVELTVPEGALQDYFAVSAHQRDGYRVSKFAQLVRGFCNVDDAVALLEGIESPALLEACAMELVTCGCPVDVQLELMRRLPSELPELQRRRRLLPLLLSLAGGAGTGTGTGNHDDAVRESVVAFDEADDRLLRPAQIGRRYHDVVLPLLFGKLLGDVFELPEVQRVHAALGVGAEAFVDWFLARDMAELRETPEAMQSSCVQRYLWGLAEATASYAEGASASEGEGEEGGEGEGDETDAFARMLDGKCRATARIEQAVLLVQWVQRMRREMAQKELDRSLGQRRLRGLPLWEALLGELERAAFLCRTLGRAMSAQQLRVRAFRLLAEADEAQRRAVFAELPELDQPGEIARHSVEMWIDRWMDDPANVDALRQCSAATAATAVPDGVWSDSVQPRLDALVGAALRGADATSQAGAYAADAIARGVAVDTVVALAVLRPRWRVGFEALRCALQYDGVRLPGDPFADPGCLGADFAAQVLEHDVRAGLLFVGDGQRGDVALRLLREGKDLLADEVLLGVDDWGGFAAGVVDVARARLAGVVRKLQQDARLAHVLTAVSADTMASVLAGAGDAGAAGGGGGLAATEALVQRAITSIAFDHEQVPALQKLAEMCRVLMEELR